MDVEDWVRKWPRCLLLLELTARYAESGRAHDPEKLKDRLEEWRVEMDGAPSLVHLLLSELCYVAWLLRQGHLETARHHVAEAERKAGEIGQLLRHLHYAKARKQSSGLRRRSRHLQERIHELLERSDHLLAQSAALRRVSVGEAGIRDRNRQPAHAQARSGKA
jgi:hypothetical protein